MRQSLESTPLVQLLFYARQYIRDFLRKKVLGLRYSSMYGPHYIGIEKDLQEHAMLTVIARQWAIGNRKARLDLARPVNGRVFLFRYEDFMKKPQHLFRKIYDYCELEYDSAMACVAEKVVDPSRQENGGVSSASSSRRYCRRLGPR